MNYDDERRLACAVRLAIATAKKCTSESCSAAMVADIVEKPEAYFAPSTSFPEALCWDGTGSSKSYALPRGEFQRIVELASRLLDLHAHIATLDRRRQAIALVRWLVVTVALAGGDDRLLREVADALVALLEQDYARAINGGLQLAIQLAGPCTAAAPRSLGCLVRDRLRGAMRLIGAVAVYMEAYSASKETPAGGARARRSLPAGASGVTRRVSHACYGRKRAVSGASTGPALRSA